MSIVVCAFVFANLIVAVVVTNLERAYRAKKEQEAMKKRDLKKKVHRKNGNWILLGFHAHVDDS